MGLYDRASCKGRHFLINNTRMNLGRGQAACRQGWWLSLQTWLLYSKLKQL